MEDFDVADQSSSSLVLYDDEQQQNYLGNNTNNNATATNYELGYHLALAFACIVGFVFSILVGCGVITTTKNKRKQRRERQEERHYYYHEEDVSSSLMEKTIQVVLLNLLGGSVALLVWGSFARVLSNKHINGQDEANALACIIFGAIAFSCINPCFATGKLTEQQDQNNDRDERSSSSSTSWSSSFRRMNIVLASTYCLLLPGLVILAIANKNMNDAKKYTLMEMSVTGSKVEYDKNIRCNRGGVCTGYRGQVELSWDAEELFCPQQVDPYRSCSVWIVDTWCDRYTGEYDSFGDLSDKMDESSAMKSVRKCMVERYSIDNSQMVVVPLLSNDIVDEDDWPKIAAYGTCSSTCEAALGLPGDVAANMKPVGLGMTIAGASIIFCCIGLAIATKAATQHTIGPSAGGERSCTTSNDDDRFNPTKEDQQRYAEIELGFARKGGGGEEANDLNGDPTTESNDDLDDFEKITSGNDNQDGIDDDDRR